MVFHKPLLSSLLSLASLQTISALPTTQNAVQSYPEVIPGPGLPSLESLNLTSAQLYEMPLPKPSMSSRSYFEISFCRGERGEMSDFF